MEHLTSNEEMIAVVSNLVGIIESKTEGTVIPTETEPIDQELLTAAKKYLIKLFKEENNAK